MTPNKTNMTINLEKELIRQNRRVVVPSELLEILEYERNAGMLENDALQRVGMTATLEKGRNVKARIDKFKSETERFKQERVFHISQIESICKKYHLRFLPSYSYKGTIDPNLATKIVNFEAAYGVECVGKQPERPESVFTLRMPWFTVGDLEATITSSSTTPEVEEPQAQPKAESRKPNCLIVAPKESFRLQERPKDPLFFYQINDEYFYLIHKWGNDLSVFRRIIGLFKKNDEWRSQYID